MFHNKPFKKDITAFAKGGKVVKHVGKGAKEQKRGFGGSETMTGGDPYSRSMNLYPKPPAEPSSGGGLGGPAIPPSPVPAGSRPPSAPTAMAPPSFGGEGEEE